MAHESYRLDMPAKWMAGVVFASPHSGAHYPSDLLQATALDEKTLRSSEDAFVDQLFAKAPNIGAPLLAARYPRAYVDLNRGRDEFDPALINDVPRKAINPRVASGLGVIPRVVANGRAIYRGKIPLAEAESRLENVWHPYHAELSRLLSEARARFGEVLLVDCHSMPHEAIDSVATGRKCPDVVLGDRFGASADGALVEVIESALSASGLYVARNAPFAGAYTAQTYGRPSHGQHVIQIEIDRALYMDERQITPRPDFARVQLAMTQMMGEVMAYLQGRNALAAE